MTDERPTPDALNAVSILLRELLAAMGLPAWQANHRATLRLWSMLAAEREFERGRCAKIADSESDSVAGREIAAAIRSVPPSS
jgi:hypothetical protein